MTRGHFSKQLRMLLLACALLVTPLTLAVTSTQAASATADQIWYQSVGRESSDALCDESSTEDLATGWTQWAPSWAQWANNSAGGFVCNRQITWAYDSIPQSASVTCTTTSGGSIPTACALGTYGPGGGLVFLISGGLTYEMAPKTWDRGTEPSQVWTTDATTCYDTTVDTDADLNCQTHNLYPETTSGAQAVSTAAATAIGMGTANTNAIIARMNDGIVTSSADYAAGLARGYVGAGGTSDWFLPSKDELKAMYDYSKLSGFNSAQFGFNTGGHWSSSQNGASVAWFQNFGNGDQRSDGNKNAAGHVRPVRAF